MNFSELINKLGKYCNTAINVFQNGTNADGTWKNTKEKGDFEGLLVKSADTQEAIRSIEKNTGASCGLDLPFIVGIEGLKAAAQAISSFNGPDYSGVVLADPGGVADSDNGARCLQPAQKKTYNALFGGSVNNNGFRSFNDYLFALKTRDTRRLLNSTGGNEGSGSSGGFLVPSQFASIFMDKTFENSIILPGCFAYEMKSKTLTVPGFDSSDHSDGGIFGGVKAFWKGEGDNNDIQVPRCRQMTLEAKTLILMTAATQQLTEDAPGFEPTIEAGFARAAAFEVDYSLMNGTGAGQPLGFLNHASVVTAAKSASQTADTLTYGNVVAMLSRLHPACLESAIWIAHTSCLPQLLSMTLPNGLINAFTYEGGIYRLLGKQVYFSEKSQPLGDRGDITLIDRSQYIVGIRKEITMDTSDHIYFNTLEKAYRTVMRLDGQPAWNAPVTQRNGGDTLSWCVTLEAR